MAPKKKQPASKQKQKPKPKPSSASSSSSAAAAAPRLQISSENERRLRRLLLNSSATTNPSPASADGPAARGESREQKARRLRGVYDKLALEGFSSAQIEQALSAISDSATFESALDWLCFNLPGDELPLKFSSGTSATSSGAGAEGSVKVLSTAKDNWVPQSREPEEVKGNTEGLEIRIGSRREEDVSLDDGWSSCLVSLQKMSSIVEDWISRANAKQRCGRAGRVKPGLCFCLYTRHRFENIMRPFQVPEMLRMPLTELCLQIKSLNLGDIKSFLLKAVEPPNEEAISSAVDLLYKVAAFEGREELSPLGYHLAKLPVDVLIGKMMLYGAIFGCLSPVLSVAAFLSYKSPFISPKDEKQNVEKAKAALLNENLDGSSSTTDNKQSDHLLMVIAYNKWSRILLQNGTRSARQFCHSFYLNSTVMYMIRDMRLQFGTLLADIGLIDLPKDSLRPKDGRRKDILESWFSNMSLPFNMYARCTSVMKSVICAGLYPNVAATLEGVDPGALGGRKPYDILFSKDRPRWYDGRREVHIHPSSVNHCLKAVQYPFLVFLEKVETTKVFLRDTSVISPYSLLLFGGSMVIQHQTGVVVIDGWLRLAAAAQTAVLFKQLRITLDAVLKELTRKPEMATFVDNEVVRSIIHLLLEEDKAQQA